MLLSHDVNIRISSSESPRSRLGRPGSSAPSRSSIVGGSSQSQPPTIKTRSPVLLTHPTVMPPSITAAPTHATPQQSPKVALPQTAAEPAPPCAVSSGEVSQEESISGHTISPQAVNTGDFSSGPVNISTGEVIDPTPPHAECDEGQATGRVRKESRDSGVVISPVTSPIQIRTSVVSTPATPVRNLVVPTLDPTTAVPTPVRSPVVQTPAMTSVSTPAVRTPAVRTPARTRVQAKPKKSFYQKCVDAVKNGLGVGRSS